MAWPNGRRYAATGELLRELTIDPRRNYQPTGRPPGQPQTLVSKAERIRTG